jgi:curved DNA-binding protein CbpA
MAQPKFKDYFELLEVTKDSTKDEIKRAFMTKALIWHPDKATTEAKKKIHTRIYTDLQEAYRILSNEESRKQYVDANQPTQLDLLNRDGRDVTYARPMERFDRDEFSKRFDAQRADPEFAKLNSAFSREAPVRRGEVDSFIRQRDMDLRSFGTHVPDFSLRPMATSLEEVTAYNDGLEETNGIGATINFGSYGIDNIISEPVMFQGVDPRAAISDAKITKNEIQQRLEEIQRQREELSKLKGQDFKIVKSDIEQAYPDLFKPTGDAIEGLTKK